MSTVTTGIIVPSNPADQKTILNALKEADNCLLRIDSERDQIKVIIDDLNTKFPDLGKKWFSWAIKRMHKGDVDEVLDEAETFTSAFETIVK
jgi:hypothetical protein